MARMTAERLEQLRDEDRRWDPGPIFYNSDTIWPLQRRALLVELDEVTRERDFAIAIADQVGRLTKQLGEALYILESEGMTAAAQRIREATDRGGTDPSKGSALP